MNNNNIISRLNLAIVYSFYALIYFLPISIALVESFFGLSLFLFFLKRGFVFYLSLKERNIKGKGTAWHQKGILFIKSFKPVSTYLSWPIAAFIFAGLLCVITSHDYRLSLQGFFFKLFEWTFLYFIFVECFDRKEYLRNFIGVFLFSATLVSLSGQWQQVIGADFIRGNLFLGGRISSSLGQPNDFGSYLIIVCLATFSFVFFLKDRKDWPFFLNQVQPDRVLRLLRIFLVVIFILALTCLGLTYSRGAWIGFFVAAIFFGLQYKKSLPAIAVIIIVFNVIFIPKMENDRNASFIVDDVFLTSIQQAQLSLQNNGNVRAEGFMEKFRDFITRLRGSGRVSFWKEPIRIIKAFPFLGIGLNTYAKIAPKYKITWGAYPHNCYLQLAAEMGLIGLSAFLWVIFSLFKNSVRNFSLINDRFLKALSLGALSGLVGFLVHSFVDTNFYSVQIGNFMWVIMGVVVASQRVALEGEKGAEDSVKYGVV